MFVYRETYTFKILSLLTW